MDLQLDEMDWHIRNTGIIDIKKITPNSTPGNYINNKDAYTTFIYNKEDGTYSIGSEEYIDEDGLNFIKNTENDKYYYLKLGDKNTNPLLFNKEYLLTITPVIGKCYTHTNGSGMTGEIFKSLSTEAGKVDEVKYGECNLVEEIDTNNKGSVKNPISEEEHRKLILNYNQRKKSTDIKVEIDKNYESEDSSDYECIARLLSEFCEISSIQTSFFLYENNEYAITTAYDESSICRMSTYTGGKSYNCPPAYIRIRNGGAREFNLRVSINDLFRSTDGLGYTTTLDTENSCITELVFQLEEIAQELPINENPQNENNIDNPEIVLNDGGERYYEPWKFWFDGDLSDRSKNGQPVKSWYKKWSSWMRFKLNIHNKWVDWKSTEGNNILNPDSGIKSIGERDFDFYLGDETKKKDHL